MKSWPDEAASTADSPVGYFRVLSAVRRDGFEGGGWDSPRLKDERNPATRPITSGIQEE